MSTTKAKRAEQVAEAKKKLSPIAKSSLSVESKNLIEAHLAVKEAEATLRKSEDKLREAERQYAFNRRSLAIKMWKDRGLAWCSYKHHLAPYEGIQTVEVTSLFSNPVDPNRYCFNGSEIHNACTTCRAYITSQGVVPISTDGSFYPPNDRLLLAKADIREDGVYIKKGLDWERKQHGFNNKTDVPTFLDHLLDEDDDLPPSIEVKHPRESHEKELFVGGTFIPKEALG